MRQLRRLGVIWTIAAAMVVGSPLMVGAAEVDARMAAPTATNASGASWAMDGAAAAVLAAPRAAPSSTELALLDLTNADRARHGLRPVELDPPVLEIARRRAAAQLTNGPLSHDDGGGGLAFVGLLAESGVAYRLAGENLARWVAADPAGPERVQRAWMESSAHRENILDPTFDRLAIGAAHDERGRIAFAQIFRATP